MRVLIALTLGASMAAAAAQAQSSASPPAGKLTSIEQQMVDLQLAERKLDPQATVVTLDLASTPLGDVLAAIAKSGSITLRYHTAVTNLGVTSAIKVANVSVDAALHSVLDSKGLAFKPTGARAVFVYPDTPANREKYSESVRTFAIANAEIDALSNILNRSLTTFGADDLRPTIVTGRASRTVTVRATPDMMARIAKVIADNDKR